MGHPLRPNTCRANVCCMMSYSSIPLCSATQNEPNRTDGCGGDFQVSEEGWRSSRQDESARKEGRHPQDTSIGHGRSWAVPIPKNDAKRRRHSASPESGIKGSTREQTAQDDDLGGAVGGYAQVISCGSGTRRMYVCSVM